MIIAHIYIGTIGMEGAFDAMGSGEVDRNWAREHHNLWIEELERRGRLAPGDDSLGRARPATAVALPVGSCAGRADPGRGA